MRRRHDTVNEHNGWVPRDFWLGMRPLERVRFVTKFAPCSFAVEFPIDLDSIAIHPPIPGQYFPA
jgi:hypothetical protein